MQTRERLFVVTPVTSFFVGLPVIGMTVIVPTDVRVSFHVLVIGALVFFPVVSEAHRALLVRQHVASHERAARQASA